jgi:hypothetical protein
MNQEQYFKEGLEKLPISLENKKDDLIHILSFKSEIEQLLVFRHLCLSSYEILVWKLGYLPSEFIEPAVYESIMTLRSFETIGQFYQDIEFPSYENRISNKLSIINHIGEGIAAAINLEDKEKLDKNLVIGFTGQSFIDSLSSRATAENHFLFNVMFGASKLPPYEEVSVSHVFLCYYQRQIIMRGIDKSDIDISVPLLQTAEDIFGIYNPLHPRISKKSNSSSGGIVFIILAILTFVGVAFFTLSADG